MNTRMRIRGLVAIAAAGCLFGIPAYAAGKPEKPEMVHLQWASGASLDPTFAAVSVAKKLGFFNSNGVDLSVQITPVSGGAGILPLVSSGRAQVGYTGAEAMISSAARGQDTGVVVFFDQNRESIFRVGVQPDSPIKSLRDLKGKLVGAQINGSAMTDYLRGYFKSVGMDPAADISFVGVGGGAGALSELRRGNVAALLMADTVFANLENRGVKFRYLDAGEYAKNYTAGGLFAKHDYLAKHKNVLCALGRGIAMGVDFTLANPEAAVRIHWAEYPESKPTNADDATALRETLHVLAARSYKWNPAGHADPRHGASEGAAWEAVAQALGLSGKVDRTAIEKMFTNELVDCFNDFDAAKVRTMAKKYKIK